MTQDFLNRMSLARDKIAQEYADNSLQKPNAYNFGKESTLYIYNEIKSLEDIYECKVKHHIGYILTVSVEADIRFEKRLFRKEIATKSVIFVIEVSPNVAKSGPELGEVGINFTFKKVYIYPNEDISSRYRKSDPISYHISREYGKTLSIQDGLDFAAKCIAQIFDEDQVRKR